MFRVGIVHYLNSRPLAWGFRRGEVGKDFDPRYLPPAAVADGLASAELELGLVPAIELRRIPGLRMVPGTCVAATREVRSVLLVSQRRITAIRRLSLDRNSRTSAALARILLSERYGVEPECAQAPADLEKMLATADAALLIGDPALHVDRSRYRVLDLAAEWRALTGLPFVFAVWAARAEVWAPELSRPFRASLALAETEMDELIREAAAETGLGIAVVRDYLMRCLSFHLGREELAGLEEFLRRAYLHGLCGRPAPLEPGSE